MRTTKTLSITLPLDILDRAHEMARSEHLTMSQLIRKALQQYDRKNWWDEMNVYGQQKAKLSGRTEADVVAR